MRRRIVIFLPLLLGLTLLLFAEESSSSNSSFSIHVIPGFDLPLAEAAENYYSGVSSRINGEYAFTRQPAIFASAGLDYSFIPYKAENSLSLLSAEAGVGIEYEFLPRFSVRAQISAGGHYAFVNGRDIGEGGTATSLSGGLRFDFILNPGISIGIGAVYKKYLGLYDGLSIQIGPSFYFSGKEARRDSIESSRETGVRVPGLDEGIKIRNLYFSEIFPVFHKYYDDHAVGTGLMENIDSEEVSDIKLTLLIRQYMDSPKVCPAPQNLAPGESAPVEFYALLKDTVMEITEGAKVPAEITLEYKMGDNWYRETQTPTISLYHRNAVTWDDDRKASAFVTAKDPILLGVSKNIAGLARNHGIKAINRNLSIAIAAHEALSLYGVNYVIDPTTPYESFSESTTMVDYLQFPRDTLRYKAGDCDDLSILFCAMLESVGIKTAFITVPGHIYIAFSTDIPADQLQGGLLQQDEVIIHNDKVWIPVEVTERKSGFLSAWQTGIKEWQRYTPMGTAAFYPMSEAWELYQPVGVKESMNALVFPDDEVILEAYRVEASRFLDTHLRPLILSAEATIESRGKNPRTLNRLGTLYARYGKLDEAENSFLEGAQLGEYLPIYLNLGNIYFLQGRYEDALRYTNSAGRLQPRNANVNITLARIHYELADYEKVDELYSLVEETNPSLADKFSYLNMSASAGNRASDSMEMEGYVLWEE